MLYFTKFKVLTIYIFIICISFFTLSNFLSDDNKLINKKINLGLDLQGGSYLLLEIDNRPIILQKLQVKLTSLKNDLIKNDIKFKNIKFVHFCPIMVKIWSHENTVIKQHLQAVSESQTQPNRNPMRDFQRGVQRI